MKRIYGNEYTQLRLTGKALEAYDNIMDITIIEYLDKAYHIKPEYFSLWGEDADENTIIWDDSLRYYADEWETTETDLLEQLEPFPVYGVKGQVESNYVMTEDELIKFLTDYYFD